MRIVYLNNDVKMNNDQTNCSVILHFFIVYCVVSSILLSICNILFSRKFRKLKNVRNIQIISI